MTPADRRLLLRLVSAYAALAALWILLSDFALAWLAPDPATLTSAQSIKGFAFVLVSAALMFGLLARELRSRRAAEASLDVAREQFRSAFDSTSVFMALLRRRDRLIVDVNDAWAQALGCERAELVGRPLHETEIGFDPQQIGPLADALRGDGSVRGFEHAMTGAGGRRLDLLTCADPVPLAGEPGWLFVASDLTHLRRSEAEIQKLERQFQQAQKMESLGTLAGGVAHDFNNLLGVILSYADFARESLPPPHPAREDIAEIITAGKRATGLTQQLLAFCRQQSTEPAVIRLDRAVGELRKMLGRLIGEDVELIVDLPAELPPVFMDPQLLDQALINLAVNARDAMPTGGRLRIAAEVREPSDDDADATQWWVCVLVSDSGSGMDAGTRQRAFEPFFSTKGKAGTGLGLSLVFGAVTQAGGRVSVESEVGRGTTFQLTFPALAHEGRPELAAEEARTRDLRGEESILVVEDEGPVRELLRRILTRHGYQVTTAADATEALRLFSSDADGSIHLVVSDVVLPRMSGVELGRHLAEIAPETPILFMTGYVDETLRRHGLSDEGADFNLIRKPFRAVDFVGKIRSLLDARFDASPSIGA